MNAHPLTNEINAILDRHQIAPACREHFLTLVHEGRIDDQQFRIRLQSVVNYETALYEVLELLSRSYRHLFEPSSFESLKVDHEHAT